MSNTVAPKVRAYRQLIAGEWVDASSGSTFKDMNPYDSTVFAEIPASSGEDAQRAIAAADKAFAAWVALGARARQALFLKAADIVERRANDIVLIMAQETGAASPFARFQIQWAIGLLRQAAGYPYLSGGEVVPSDTPGVFAMGCASLLASSLAFRHGTARWRRPFVPWSRRWPAATRWC